MEHSIIFSKLTFKYPDRVPVIIQKATNCKEFLDNNKYLIPKSLTISEVIYIIRKKIKINEKHAIFIFVNQGNSATLVPCNMNMLEVYNTYKSDDNILYITYTIENTFG